MAGGTFSGPRSRLQVRVRVRVRESGPGPVPVPEDLNLIPDGRDLGPENDFITAVSFPVSGLPLSWSLGRADHPWSAAVERGRSTLPQDSGCDVIASLPHPPPAKLPLLRSMPACQQIPTRPQAETASQQFTMPAVPRRQAHLAGISFNVYHPSLCHRVAPAFDLISPRARWWTLPRTRPSTMRRTLSPSAETVADLMVGVV